MADTVPLATPRTTLASSQALYGSSRRSVTGVPWPERGGRAEAEAGRRRRRASTTSSGMPPGQVELATRNLRSLRMRAWSSSQPIVSTSHFMRARSLLSRLPWLENTRRIASIVASRSSRGVNSSSARAGCGLAPRPPATNTRKPASRVPSSSVRVVAITPTSLNIAWPQSVSQPEKLILNFRGQPLGERVVEEVLEGGLGPRADVEVLVGAGAGEVAAHHVADGVAARLPGGEPDRWPCRAGRRGPARGRRSGTACSAGW